MRPVHVQTTIDAPRERVFELVADLARRPSFCDHFQRRYRLERLPSRGAGAAARFRVEAPRLHIWMESAVEELQAPHRVLERGRGGRWDRIPIFTVWELAAGPGEASEVSVTFWTEPDHPLDRLREHLGAVRWYRRRWAQALRRLRELAESGREADAVAVAGGSRAPNASSNAPNMLARP